MTPMSPGIWMLCRRFAGAVCALGIVLLFVFGDNWLPSSGLDTLLISATSLIAVILWLVSDSGYKSEEHNEPGNKPAKESTPKYSNRYSPPSPLPPSPEGPQSLLKISDQRILVLTNDKSDRHGILRHLDSWGITPTVCSTAARSFYELLRASEAHSPYHVVIVDRGLFDMDASQFSAALRSEQHLQDIYLILIGARPAEIEEGGLNRLGYTRLVPVPLNKTLLFDALHNLRSAPLEPRPGVAKIIDRYTASTTSPPLSILLAENRRGEQQRIRAVLQQQGHQVFLVDSGARVLDALDSHQFDLAIVSRELREISGIEAFNLYRFTRIDKQRTPFILLLHNPGDSDRQRCEESGVNAILEAGADPKTIMNVLKKVVLESGDQGQARQNYHRQHLHQTTGFVGGHTADTALDRNRLAELENLGGNTAFLSDLIDSFNRDNRHFLTQMELAIKKGDLSRFRDLGHAIKDSAGSLGTIRLFELGTAASHIPSEAFRQNALDLLQQLTECCRLSNDALQNYIREKDLRELDYRKD